MEKKAIITATIAVHPIQAAIIIAAECGRLDFEEDSLLTIASKLNLDEDISAQQIKHHLEQLINLGALQRIYGTIVFTKSYVEAIEKMNLKE